MTSAFLPDALCFLDGHYGPVRDARISPLDRGFIFGDGVYEVVPAYGGRPFRFDEHMARLDRSLRELRIPNPHTREQWLAITQRLIADRQAAGIANQLVYLQVTRGVAVRDHVMPEGLTPTVFALASEMKQPSASQRAQGVACVTADDFRWRKAHIKSTSLLGSVLARQISADAGATETVMFRDGYLSEAAASNVWVVKDGAVLGTPTDGLVLEGIRYGLIESICRDEGIPFTLRRVSRDEVFAADEMLLSSATKEVLPVTRLDGRPVGSGVPGPIALRLHAAYQRAIAAPSR